MTQTWRADYGSWGRVVTGRHQVTRPATTEQAAREVSAGNDLPVIAYGCGRSYGDVALNPRGRLIDCRDLDRFLAFDRETGLLTCETGVRLADILAIICKPEADGSGWFLPVTPGTRFVTVGGAIANDVHGKNHHTLGTFGRHVVSFDLARSDGRQMTCSPTENASLFAATIGGMGLTGLILRATIQLKRVVGFALETEDIRFNSLDEFFNISAESDGRWEYTAAWVDCLAKGQNLGRGIFSRANHAAGPGGRISSRKPRLTFPMTPPISLATSFSVRAFNAVYWRKLGIRRTRAHRIGNYEPVLYPLDAVGNWNRVYGPQGFYQFQCVVPPGTARDALAEMLLVIGKSGQGSMLSVLKVFGDQPSPGLMSFPMPGTTLALDFPNHGKTTRQLLANLEQITMASGGRIYAAKDGAMSAETFHKGYPLLVRFLPKLDPKFSSSFAQRVALVPRSAVGSSGMSQYPSSRPTIAIFGATSDIAVAVARRYAEAGDRLVLVGRDEAALIKIAADITTRGAEAVAIQVADFGRSAELPAVVTAAWERFGGLDIAIVAYGTLPDQRSAETDDIAAQTALLINFNSPVLLINELARYFERQGRGGRSGSIAAITSVAGDRGRKSNYVYGAAKGGLQRYLEGLRHRLHKAGVNVLDIRPGFVSTKMTAHLNTQGPLWAKPDRIGGDIIRAIASRRAILYTPRFWQGVMLAVRNIPRPLFHRTSL